MGSVRRRHFLIPIALALVLSACAELRWQRPGTDEAAILQDFVNCRSLAQQKINRLWGPDVPISTDPRFGPRFEPTSAQRQLLERDAEDHCMRERAYTIVRVKG